MNRMTIRYGSTGKDVESACYHLARHGVSIDPDNHLFDWHMYVRVLQFQIKTFDDKSDMDGIIGPRTWRALLEGAIPENPTEPPMPSTPPAMPSVELMPFSRNQSERGATITHVVLHNTAGAFQGSVEWLCNPQAQASAHLVISRKAQTAQIVPFAKKAWHAGNARMNANSIGIEIEATTTQRGMTPAQEARVIEWVKWLMKEYDIPAANIGIHRWYRNTDCPGLIWPTDAEFKTWRNAHFGG